MKHKDVATVWRKQTLATKLQHRHEHSGWVTHTGTDRYARVNTKRRSNPRMTWGAVMWWVLSGIAAVCAVAWAFKELLP